MSTKEEKTQYEFIQEFLTNDNFHFNHLMIKAIIKFLYEKFGSEFWKYIIDVVKEDNPSLFKSFRKYNWEWAEQLYHFNRNIKRDQKELKRSKERRQRNKELDEEEREYRKKHPNPWGH